MKLLKATKSKLIFQLAEVEKHLLLELLKLYPRVPSNHGAVSKSGRLPDAPASQKLLEEALAEHRAENKRHLEALLKDSRRWSEEDSQWLFSLSTAEVEWMLQVLNDVRIGSWVMLGSPEQTFESVSPQNVLHLWAMESAGDFQIAFLHALEGKEEIS